MKKIQLVATRQDTHMPFFWDSEDINLVSIRNLVDEIAANSGEDILSRTTERSKDTLSITVTWVFKDQLAAGTFFNDLQLARPDWKDIRNAYFVSSNHSLVMNLFAEHGVLTSISTLL